MKRILFSVAILLGFYVSANSMPNSSAFLSQIDQNFDQNSKTSGLIDSRIRCIDAANEKATGYLNLLAESVGVSEQTTIAEVRPILRKLEGYKETKKCLSDLKGDLTSARRFVSDFATQLDKISEKGLISY